MEFCGAEITSRFFLAPLAGYTDAGFRALVAENGAAVTYTEMVSAKGMCYGSPGTDALLYTTATESNVAVQLFGSEPEFMRRAAADARIGKFAFVDINMGCPVKKIFSNGDGSALMKDPALIEDVVRATAEGARKPVTVKIRAGITEGETLAVKCAEAAVRGGAAAVAVHPRYREQMYGGIADHGITAAVKEAVGVPVVASGDITDAESFIRIKRESKADFFMIGRGALGRPWIFRALAELDEAATACGDAFALENAERFFVLAKSRFDALDAAKRHLATLLEVLPPRAAANSMKLHLCKYAVGTPNAKRVREEVVSATTPDDIIAVAEKYLGCSDR